MPLSWSGHWREAHGSSCSALFRVRSLTLLCSETWDCFGIWDKNCSVPKPNKTSTCTFCSSPVHASSSEHLNKGSWFPMGGMHRAGTQRPLDFRLISGLLLALHLLLTSQMKPGIRGRVTFFLPKSGSAVSLLCSGHLVLLYTDKPFLLFHRGLSIAQPPCLPWKIDGNVQSR